MSGIAEKRGDLALAYRRVARVDRRGRIEREERADGLGAGVEMDQLRSGVQEGSHSRSYAKYQTRSLGHAVLLGERQGPSVRLGQRRLQTDHHRDSQVPLRPGDDHTEGHGGSNAGDRATSSPARDPFHDRWLERRLAD